MIGKGAYEIRAVTLAEVAKILEKRQGMVGEFGFEQQNALDYARKFARLKLSDAQGMQAELEKLGVKPESAVKIVDILPQNRQQLLLILAKDKTDFPEKKLAEIEEVVAQFSKKARKIEPSSPAKAESEPLPQEPPAENEGGGKKE
ncbi:MAG: DNA-directed RNA polymerase subunit F [Candidatus Micrarchaeota archaeon]|nr:DNA-directed RNA polymerase subunit F [Candidatus Micrarchaeota archaeon]